MGDANRLQELTVARNAAAQKVHDWIQAENQKGNTPNHNEAPDWEYYMAAKAALSEYLRGST